MVVTLCPTFPGVTRVFQELEKVASTQHIAMSGPVRIPEAGVAILGAYHFWYEKMLLNRPKKTRVGLLVTSPLTQVDLVREEPDIVRILKLLESGRLDFVWVGHWSMKEIFEDHEVYHCLYPATVPEKVESGVYYDRGATLLGPMHFRKNVLTQMLAAKKADVTLFTNGIGPDYQSFAQAIGLRLKDEGWMEWTKYLELVASCRVGLQVSHLGAESFSYVTFDHLSMEVPCLTTVPWAPDDLAVLNPSDVEEIVTRMKGLKPSPNYRAWAQGVAERNNKAVVKFISALRNTA